MLDQDPVPTTVALQDVVEPGGREEGEQVTKVVVAVKMVTAEVKNTVALPELGEFLESPK